MNEIRDTEGKFASRKVRRPFIVFLVITAFLGFNWHFPAWWIDNSVSARNLVPTAFAAVQSDLEIKIVEMQDEVLAKLAKCESNGLKEEDGIAHLDSNDVGSYGPYQFQRKTVMHFMELQGKPVNGRDAIVLSLKGDESKELARYIIFETSKGVASDWVNCSKRLNLQQDVNLIKKLMK